MSGQFTPDRPTGSTTAPGAPARAGARSLLRRVADRRKESSSPISTSTPPLLDKKRIRSADENHDGGEASVDQQAAIDFPALKKSPVEIQLTNALDRNQELSEQLQTVQKELRLVNDLLNSEREQLISYRIVHTRDVNLHNRAVKMIKMLKKELKSATEDRLTTEFVSSNRLDMLTDLRPLYEEQTECVTTCARLDSVPLDDEDRPTIMMKLSCGHNVHPECVSTLQRKRDSTTGTVMLKCPLGCNNDGTLKLNDKFISTPDFLCTTSLSRDDEAVISDQVEEYMDDFNNNFPTPHYLAAPSAHDVPRPFRMALVRSQSSAQPTTPLPATPVSPPMSASTAGITLQLTNRPASPVSDSDAATSV